MCEADAYMVKEDEEQLIMEAVDIVESEQGGVWRLVSIFGDQKRLKGRLMRMNLVDHKILFEESA